MKSQTEEEDGAETDEILHFHFSMESPNSWHYCQGNLTVTLNSNQVWNKQRKLYGRETLNRVM